MNGRERPVEWPDREQHETNPIFNTKAVVQQTGIPAPTLRAWERRYQIILPKRGGNSYRLYSEYDIAILCWLKEQTDNGMSISQAIALFQHRTQERQPDTQKPAPTVHNQQEALSLQPAAESKPLAYPSVFQVATSASPSKEPNSYISSKANVKRHNRQNSNLLVYNLTDLSTLLIDTFQRLDDRDASTLMSTILAIHPVERVCIDLIKPTLWQLGQLWDAGQITGTVEHFASNFFRGWLAKLLHVTPNPHYEQLVIVCCAPGEPHEIAALMLALFLKRRGVRVAYLGQSIEASGLLDSIKTLSPALLCISLTIPSYLPALIHLSQQLQELPEPRPALIFGGQAFTNAHYANAIPQISGLYQEGDLVEVADRLYCMIKESVTQK